MHSIMIGINNHLSLHRNMATIEGSKFINVLQQTMRIKSIKGLSSTTSICILFEYQSQTIFNQLQFNVYDQIIKIMVFLIIFVL